MSNKTITWLIRLILIGLLLSSTVLPFATIDWFDMDSNDINEIWNGIDVFTGNGRRGDNMMLFLFVPSIVGVILSFAVKNKIPRFISLLTLLGLSTYSMFEKFGNRYGIYFNGIGYYLSFTFCITGIVLCAVGLFGLLQKNDNKAVQVAQSPSNTFAQYTDAQLIQMFNRADPAKRKVYISELIERGYFKRDASGKVVPTGKRPK